MIPSNLANVSVSMKGVLLRFVGCGGVVRGLCHGAYMCVCLRSLWDSPRSRVLRSGLASEALRVVLRGFVVLPLLTQGQLYAVYLFFTTLHRRRWVSLTYHEARRSGGPRPPCHRRGIPPLHEPCFQIRKAEGGDPPLHDPVSKFGKPRVGKKIPQLAEPHGGKKTPTVGRTPPARTRFQIRKAEGGKQNEGQWVGGNEGQWVGGSGKPRVGKKPPQLAEPHGGKKTPTVGRTPPARTRFQIRKAEGGKKNEGQWVGGTRRVGVRPA